MKRSESSILLELLDRLFDPKQQYITNPVAVIHQGTESFLVNTDLMFELRSVWQSSKEQI